ncbi:receptor-like protein eix2 [Quercus suber]|uniref:Receptor-like protein eix2 n=1 Tax=Quercus suber TaxID=58331 RepID=A0AAW0JMX0_QUESU
MWKNPKLNWFLEFPSKLVIDLGGNCLLGNLPSWIGSNVLILYLREIILRQWCNLPSLYILDLAQNNLFRDILDCLDNLTGLVYGKINFDVYPFGFAYIEKAIILTKRKKCLNLVALSNMLPTLIFHGIT